jgi:DNA recombination protein RmuC
MTDAIKKVAGVSDAFIVALARLSTGRGNLVGRVEEIRELGIKVKKQLPDSVIDESGQDM